MNIPLNTRPQIKELLSRGIGPTIHWFPETCSISDLATTMVGMANADGGTILLGISPRQGRIQGIRDTKAAIDRVFQAAVSCDPPLVLPVPNVESMDEAVVLRVTIPNGLPHLYSYQGRYFGRRGHQNIQLTPQRLRQLLMERGVIQFENQIPLNATMDDLDLDRIFTYMESQNWSELGNGEEVLLRRGCIRVDEGVLRPTYASILLFGISPQQWLPNASILAARFPGETFSDEFIKQDIRGTIPEQIHQAVNFVRYNQRSVARLVGLTRQETSEYPLEAVRELLVNAVAHRDYNLGGDGIHLNIFSNRLEVSSPGVLPGPVNLDNLLVTRFSRNPVIAQILSDFGYVERLGYGLKRVVAVLRKNNQPDPRFEELGGSFRVTLYPYQDRAAGQKYQPDLSKYQKFDLNQRQEMALNHLLELGRITNRSYQELCPEVSSETLRRDLVDLIQKGILIKVGDRKATYYILK